MARRSVNIAAVAAQAGVGVGTVSRVLNDSPQVSADTRRRVLDVIGRLGYRPSHLAASLSRGSTGSVAILAPHVTRPSVVFRLEGMLSVLEEHGLDAVLCNISTPEQRDRHIHAFTDPHRADGIIVVSMHLSRAQVAAMRSSGIPAVSLDADTAGMTRVVVDDVAAGRLATERLLALGHRRIAFVGDRHSVDIGFVSSDRRLAGYRRALAEAGVEGDDDLVRLAPHGAAQASQETVQLLALDLPPTAVFAASDTQAMGVLHAAEQLGVRVPDHLSVMGFDDIEAASLLRLSTIRQPMFESGARAARHLCRMIGGETGRPEREVLAVELVERETTAAPGATAAGRRGHAA
jgi:DNA-binding LacI/PurR family transcriptional regulator